MKAVLCKVLTSLKPVDFEELRHCILIADKARRFLFDHKISEKVFAKSMELSELNAKKFLAGSYPYDVRTLARLNVFIIEKLQEEVAKEDIIRVKLDAKS